MTLSSLIVSYRESHGLSQRQFAALCGLSNGSVSLIEGGLNPSTGKPIKPSLNTLQCIATGMSISLHDLLSTADDLTIDLDNTSDDTVSLSPMEKELIDMFRHTTEHGRMRIISTVVSICEEIEKNAPPADSKHTAG